MDLNGNAITLPRFQCNLALQARRSAGRLGARDPEHGAAVTQLRASRRLAVAGRERVAEEQADKPEWSNAEEPLERRMAELRVRRRQQRNVGHPAAGERGAERAVVSRSMAETPNRFTVEFQDALNEYQQDSFSLVDPEDVARSGQEVAATYSAIGIPNYDQAARMLKVSLDKSVRGNTYIEFETSVKAFGDSRGRLDHGYLSERGIRPAAVSSVEDRAGVNHRRDDDHGADS